MILDRIEFRRKTGVTPVMELPLRTERLDVRYPPGDVVSVRPVLVVTDDPASEAAKREAQAVLSSGRPVAVYVPRKNDGSAATCARRAEDVLDAARRLSHANAGKTVEVWAEGTAIEPAAWMFYLERFYFSTFTAFGTCAERKGFPSWKELVK